MKRWLPFSHTLNKSCDIKNIRMIKFNEAATWVIIYWWLKYINFWDKRCQINWKCKIYGMLINLLKVYKNDYMIITFEQVFSRKEKNNNDKKHRLFVLIMSCTRFRVNPHSIVAWISRNLSLLETGAIFEV